MSSLLEMLDNYKEEKVSKYEVEGVKEEDKHHINTVERGIDFELEKMKIDTSNTSVDPKDYEKAKKKALKNLEKDPNYYYHLMSGSNRKTERHDKYQEVKSDNHVDVFNGMKKAQLKEVVKKLIVNTLKEEKQELNTKTFTTKGEIK